MKFADYNAAKRQKRRRDASAFVTLIATPVAAGVQGTFPANARVRLTCVTVGGAPVVSGNSYAGLTAGKQVVLDKVEKNETFTIDAGSRLDVDTGLGKWKKIAGGS